MNLTFVQQFLFLAGVVMVSLPILWLYTVFSEEAWTQKRWVRAIVGLVTIVDACLLTGIILGGYYLMIGVQQTFTTNQEVADTMSRLISTTVDGLEGGHDDRVLVELKRIEHQYHGSYESWRGHKGDIVEMVEAYEKRVSYPEEENDAR